MLGIASLFDAPDGLGAVNASMTAVDVYSEMAE
jgi:hypothetical protein